MSTEEKVTNTIRQYADIAPDVAIERSHTLRRDLGLDSLDLCYLVMDLEKIFNTFIPDEQIWDIEDVQGIIDAIDNATDKTK